VASARKATASEPCLQCSSEPEFVVASGSVALLADTIHNFADAETSIPLWIAFSLARRKASRRLKYGYGKVEDVAGVVIVLNIFFSACVAAYESIVKIIHPQPVHNLWWIAAAALIGFIGNEVVAVFRIRVGEEIGSAALIADGQHARVDGFTSLAVLVGVVGVALGVPILDITGVRAVREMRARWIGHRVYSDLAIEVDPKLSVGEGDVLAQQVEKSLHQHVRLLGKVVVRICPASGDGRPSLVSLT